MGISGLETFMETFPADCCTEVGIRQLVKEFRKERGNEEKPVIVFHMANVFKFLLKDYDWVYGGHHSEVLAKVTNLINAFTTLGIHPVLFFRGYSEKDADNFDPNFWIKNSRSRLRTIHKLYSKSANGRPAPPDDPSSEVPYIQYISYYCVTMLNCEVIKAVGVCNREVAAYAQQNENCIAIFAQDSDFIIRNSDKNYLSARHFKMKTMKTRLYSTDGLLKKLELQPWQLPLLAALMGRNHYNNIKQLRHLRKAKKWGTDIPTRYKAIANYIKEVCHYAKEPFSDSLRELLPHLADELSAMEAEYGNCMGKEKSLSLSFDRNEEPAQLVQHPNLEWGNILNRVTELHSKNLIPTVVRKVLTNQSVECMAALEDLREIPDSTSNLASSAAVTRPLRSRIYGIILFEKPERPNSVTEYSFESEDKENLFQVNVHLPKDEHPGLLELWGPDRSDEIQRQRWTLFFHAISIHLDHMQFKDLHDTLILPAATLFYLREQNRQTSEDRDLERLKDWEINALIAMVVLLEMDLTIRKPARIAPRAVHLASIFNRTLFAIMDLLAVCGYPLTFARTFRHPYFDGKLFHRKYLEAENGKLYKALCQNEANAIARFKVMSAIVFRDP